MVSRSRAVGFHEAPWHWVLDMHGGVDSTQPFIEREGEER